MYRSICLCAALACLFAVDAASADEPFKNETARAAQTAYDAAIEKAKNEYAAQLELAVKEAGASGDLEEANRIDAARKKLVGDDADPVEKLRKRLLGTRWGPSKRTTLKFSPENKVIMSDGSIGTWTVPDGETIILQSSSSGNLAIWKFNETLTAAKIFKFSQVDEKKTVINKKF